MSPPLPPENAVNPIRPFLDKTPQLGARVYVDPACTVIGDVALDEDVSVWPGTVIRGDVNHVRIGARSNIQDGSIIHVSHHSPFNKAGYPTLIGTDVTVGHGCIIHACTIEDLCLIGMGACILDGATVKKYGFVGAGAVVGPGKTVGERELWLGNPARLARTLSDKEVESLHYSAQHYVRLKDRYLGAAAPTSP
jgi:carbonic anhydrase/acetyltransferase-like protein (isoleucine patch superfamily)